MAVFMDNANDGDPEGVVEIYEDDNVNKEELLTYVNKRAKATALHLAANNGHDEIVKFLVERIKEDLPERQKELINKQNKYQFTPLMSVCFRGYLVKGKAKDADEPRLNIVKCLIEAGADVNYATSDTNMTATHWAAYNEDFAVVRELLNHGASHTIFSHMGRLPIDVGGSSRAWDVVDICL